LSVICFISHCKQWQFSWQ